MDWFEKIFEIAEEEHIMKIDHELKQFMFTQGGRMSFFAYKGFDKDLKCRGFQYEVGKTYSMEENPVICKRGYHCCTKLSDVFDYYPLIITTIDANLDRILPVKKIPSGNRYCLVEVGGYIDTDLGAFVTSSKVSTNSIKILQELTEDDIIDILEQEELEARNELSHIGVLAGEFKANVQQKRGDNRRLWYTTTRFQ